MSVRIMTDGRRAGHTDAEIRPYHKPEPAPEPNYWRCVHCGSWWHWVDNPHTYFRFRRHHPGTFWEAD